MRAGAQSSGRDADRQGPQHSRNGRDRNPAGVSDARAGISQNVTEDEPQIAVFIEQNYVAAVLRLRAYNDTFLYVARLLDPRVVAQLQKTQESVTNMPNWNRAGSAFRSPSR
jgi:nitrogen fixation/metabolism regulation signal transduction histidine kinase